MTPPRKQHAVAASSVVSEAFAELSSLVPRLTDEEWEARDAEVATARARSEAAENGDRLAELEGFGFPRRAIAAIRWGVDVTSQAISALRANDHRNVVVISGPAGCGKTLAATWWAAQRKDRIGFVRASEFATSSRYDREARAELFRSPLVLDDLGAEYVDAKGSFLTDLDALVDTFYADMRPLVITTNCSIGDFRERYDVRITDRLRESGRWISLSAASLRKRPEAT